MVACRADCSAGSATFTTVPSIKAMLEPRMVAASIQGPFVVAGRPHEPARITASSQGGLAMLAIVHSQVEQVSRPVPTTERQDTVTDGVKRADRSFLALYVKSC